MKSQHTPRRGRKTTTQQLLMLGLIIIIALGGFATALAGPELTREAAPPQPQLPDRAPLIRADEAPELRLQRLGLDQLPTSPEAQRSPADLREALNPPQGTQPLAVPGKIQPPDPARAPQP